MEWFLLEQAPHIPLLLPYLEWPDVGYLSSASHGLARSLLRDVFFRHALVVVPGCTTINGVNDVIRSILGRLSPLVRHVAISNPSHLLLLHRLPLLSMLRVAKPTVLLLDEHADDTVPIRLGHEEIHSLWRLTGIAQLEIEAHVDDLPRLFQHMDHLRTLDLVFRARIPSFDPLTELQHLRTLRVQCEAIDSIEALGTLRQLVSLSLSSWGVHDITALGYLGQLERLDLSRCNVGDLTPLQTLRHLRCLRLDETPVHDLWPLARLVNLQFLSLARSQASDLTPLGARAASLHYLDLSGCTLTHVAALSRLQQLECLRMYHTTWSSLGVELTISATLALLHNLRVVDGRVNAMLSLRPEGVHARLELSALQRMHSLETLELTSDSMSHATPPLALPYLIWLRIEWSYTREQDVPLAAVVHPRLRVLHLVRVRLRSLHNLQYAPQLQELRLDDVLLEDLSAVRAVTNLRRYEHSCAMVRSHDLDDEESLYRRAPTQDLTALGALAKLQYLDLSSTSLSDLKPLQFLVKLRYVDLSDTDVTDVSPLETLALLECIHVNDTEISCFDGGAFCRVLVELALPEHVDCHAIRRAAPQLKRLLHPDRDCLWTNHNGRVDVDMVI